MKIKVKPEDFVVEEVLSTRAGESGEFAWFQLKKHGLTTTEAIQHVARRWNIPPSRFQYAGLKDKHAVTEQTVSFEGSRQEGISFKGVELRFLGRSDRPVGPDLLDGNRFRVVVRDIPPLETEKLATGFLEVLNFGFVNYFGEQRFGSARHGHGYFARELLRGNPEKALKLYLATWDRKDRSRLKTFKKLVNDNWGDWAACLKSPHRSTERSIIHYLKDHPQDFIGAINRIPRSLLSLFLSAYQSYLWNETVRRHLSESFSREVRLVPFRNEQVHWVFYRIMPDPVFERLRDLVVPLIDKHVDFAPGGLERTVAGLLTEEGVERSQFGLKGIRNAFFKSAPRKVVVVPEDFEIDPPETDDANAGKKKIALRFSLPPGSYATVLLRRLGA